MFLHLSVILFTEEGGLCPERPPRTVEEWAVRILLESFLFASFSCCFGENLAKLIAALWRNPGSITAHHSNARNILPLIWLQSIHF